MINFLQSVNAEVPAQALNPQPPAELFPHPKALQNKARCHLCVREVQGEDYRRLRDALTRLKVQCQECAKATCPEHSVVVCLPCAANLRRT